MPFDPDKYLASKDENVKASITGFDPDKYLAKQEPEEPSTYQTYIKPWLKPTVEGLGAISGGLAGAATGALAGGVGAIPAGVAGAGLGYAGAKKGYEGVEQLLGAEQTKPLTESLKEIPSDIATGAAYEMGGQVIGKAIPLVTRTIGIGAKKVTGAAGRAYSNAMGKLNEIVTSEKPQAPLGAGEFILTPEEQVLNQQYKSAGLPTSEKPQAPLEAGEFLLTPEEQVLNQQYKSAGLPELRASQLKPQDMAGVPTRAQVFETQYGSKIPEVKNSQQQQEEAIRQLLDKYKTTSRMSEEQIGNEIMQPIQKAKGAAGEEIGKFKQAGKDISLKAGEEPSDFNFGANTELKPEDVLDVPFELYSKGKTYYDIAKERGILKKGGNGIDTLAEEMVADGTLDVPSDRNAADYLLEKIINKEPIPSMAKYTEKYTGPKGGKVASDIKNPKLPISTMDKFEQGDKYNNLLNIEKLYNEASNVQELDAVSSNVGQQISEAKRQGAYKYARKLGEIKEAIESYIGDTIEGTGTAKPKEAYKTYSKLSKYTEEYLENTTAGTAKPVNGIVKKLTSSKQELEDFINTAKDLGNDKIVQVVKEEYKRDIFNSPNALAQWKKISGSNTGRDILSTLYTPEEIAEINLSMDYIAKQKSVGINVNPSKTETSHGVKEMFINELLGKNAKERAMIEKYKELAGYKTKTPDMEKIKQLLDSTNPANRTLKNTYMLNKIRKEGE